MSFKQNYKKVTEVVNIDNSSVTEGGEKFTQSYDEVFKVINTSYDGSELSTINPLVEKIFSMNTDQAELFYKKVEEHCIASGENTTEFQELNQKIKEKNNKKEGILEYIKAGTVTLTFANSLLSIAKTILAFVAR